MAATARTITGGPGCVGPNTFKAVAAPTVDNDVTDGCKVGDEWLDTTAVKLYKCFDNADGAAVWKEITLAA
jgi:hypothetical protein